MNVYLGESFSMYKNIDYISHEIEKMNNYLPLCNLLPKRFGRWEKKGFLLNELLEFVFLWFFFDLASGLLAEP